MIYTLFPVRPYIHQVFNIFIWGFKNADHLSNVMEYLTTLSDIYLKLKSINTCENESEEFIFHFLYYYFFIYCFTFSLIQFVTPSLLFLTPSVCDELHPCEGLGRYATFRNFGMAFLLLFRVSTGDNWNGIMKVGKTEISVFVCIWNG